MLSKSTGFAFGVVSLALVAAFAPMPPGRVEQLYSTGWYPVIQPLLTSLSNLVPFALFDALMIATAIVMGLWLAAMGLRIISRGWRLVVRTVTLAAVLYLIFLAVWGLHYRREPFERTLEFRGERVSAEGLRQLADRAVVELNALSPRLPAVWPEWDDLRPELTGAFHQAAAQVGVEWRVVLARPKRSLLNLYFRETAIDGMVDPFFLEVLVNQDVLPFERPFIVSHEWAHLAGRASEAEASFLGWIACMYGPAQARYSAWISLYGTIVASLPREARAEVGDALDAGPRRDLIALRDRIARQSAPRARRASRAVYDRFLKANRLQEGVASYGQVVELLLGTRIEVPPLEQTEGRERE